MKNYFGIVVILVAVALVSCNKEKLETLDEISLKSLQIATIESTTENAATESHYEADYYMNAEKSLTAKFGKGNRWGWLPAMRYKFRQCPDVTIDSTETGYPKTITLNYGDGTELKNGRVLSGVIVIYISAEPETDGAYRETTYETFKVDTIAIEGTGKSTFTGDNVSTRIQQMASNLKFTFDNGLVVTREAEKTREWVEGIETDTIHSDDKIQITGFANATTSEGDEYEKTIIEPLIKLGDCKYIVQGVVEIIENGTTTSSIDYGDGECDSVATLTQNGETTEIELKGGKKERKGKK